MGPFIGRYGDWKMVELSGLQTKLRAVNQGRRPGRALYLYGLFNRLRYNGTLQELP